MRDRDAGACGETSKDDPVSRTGMTRSRWQYLKSVKPVATQMFVSCSPDKHKHSRATYRKAENGARD